MARAVCRTHAWVFKACRGDAPVPGEGCASDFYICCVNGHGGTSSAADVGVDS